MTTTLLRQETSAAVTDADSAPSAAVLAGELLAEHARVGAWVADLDADDGAVWAAIRPALAGLSRVGRQAADEIAVARGRALPHDGARALTQRDGVPPIVWAREIGAMQRLVRRALRDVELDGDGDAQVAAALRQALRRTRAVAADLAAAAAAA